MINPVKNPRLTQGFGKNPSIYKSFGLAGHNGLDYGCANGTPLFAPERMYCETQNDGAKTGYGLNIRGYTEQGEHVLGHLREVLRTGWVNQGELIAYSGNTGFSTGPHLHWGYRRRNGFKGNVIDYNNGFKGYIDQSNLINMGDMNNEERAKELSAARTFNAENGEVKYITNELNAGKSGYDYARSNLFRDAIVNNLFLATHGRNAPESEKNFWHQYGLEHPDQNIPEVLAKTWYSDTVAPLKDKMNELGGQNQKLGGQIGGLTTQFNDKTNEAENATNDALEALGELETTTLELERTQTQPTPDGYDVRRLQAVDLVAWFFKKIFGGFRKWK